MLNYIGDIIFDRDSSLNSYALKAINLLVPTTTVNFPMSKNLHGCCDVDFKVRLGNLSEWCMRKKAQQTVQKDMNERERAQNFLGDYGEGHIYYESKSDQAGKKHFTMEICVCKETYVKMASL